MTNEQDVNVYVQTVRRVINSCVVPAHVVNARRMIDNALSAISRLGLLNDDARSVLRDKMTAWANFKEYQLKNIK